MNLTIRELRVFRAVYELRSFSAAAAAVHMTQSAVSKVCQEVEGKVDGRLFERSTRKVEPTLLADALYGYACDILATMDAAERSLRALGDLEAGEIRVAASQMMMHGLLIGPVRRFHASYPGVHVALHELSTDETIDHVLKGRVDFGVVSIKQPHARLAIEPLYQERMYVVCAREHPLARRSRMSWEELAEYPHISLHTTFSVRRAVDRIYEQKGLGYASPIEAGSVLSVLGMVKSGCGISVLPGYVMGFVTDLGLTALPLPQGHYTHPISLIRRRNAGGSAATDALIALLRASLAEAGTAAAPADGMLRPRSLNPPSPPPP